MIENINKKDLKGFENWINKNSIFLKNTNFFTTIMNINSNKKYEDFFWDFFIYNNLVLKNKYDFYDFKIIQKNSSIIDIVKKILENIDSKNPLNNKTFYDFLFSIENYYENKLKEIDVVKKYWLFSDYLYNNYINNFNNWLIFINENLFVKQEAFLQKG